MEYEILGTPFPVVVCHLKKGESMLSDSGAMAWMDPCMELETTSNGGFGKAMGRMFSGETNYLNRYTAHADGKIAFSSSFGNLNLSWNSLLCSSFTLPSICATLRLVTSSFLLI